MLRTLFRHYNYNYNVFKNAKNYATETTIQLENVFKCYDLDLLPSSTASLSKEQALKYFTDMSTIRRMETVCAQLYREKIIRGFCHLYNGQEAIAIGVKAALRPQDSVITAYRCHGWSYAMGIGLVGVIAELTGREKGCSRGKGGSMHMYSPSFYGGNGIVGAQVPLGNGIAFQNKYVGNGGVCINLYGDGAANQGQVYESFNMACLWKLPVVFMCENNEYGLGTAANRAACDTDFYTHGCYIPGLWVDGMNILAVRTATEFALQHIMDGKGPLVVEMHTYRFMGHSMSDPGTTYRTKEEVEQIREKRDCIVRFREICITNNLFTDEEAKVIEAKIRKDVDDAANIAKSAPEIDVKELTGDVYYKCLEPKIRGKLGYNLQHIRVNKAFKETESAPKPSKIELPKLQTKNEENPEEKGKDQK